MLFRSLIIRNITAFHDIRRYGTFALLLNRFFRSCADLHHIPHASHLPFFLCAKHTYGAATDGNHGILQHALTFGGCKAGLICRPNTGYAEPCKPHRYASPLRPPGGLADSLSDPVSLNAAGRQFNSAGICYFAICSRTFRSCTAASTETVFRCFDFWLIFLTFSSANPSVLSGWKTVRKVSIISFKSSKND